MTKTFIIAARRSAVAPRGAGFAHLELHELATPVIHAALVDAGVAPDRIGELIVSNALGGGGNPARRIALDAGLPSTVAGLSIDRQCVGGLDAIVLADAMIRSGQHQIVVAGGVESYSRRPLRFQTFHDGREPVEYDQAPFTPWPDRDPNMADAAATLARNLGIDQREQDEWAIESHRKAMSFGNGPEFVEIANVSTDPFRRNLNQKLCLRAPNICDTITAANMAIAADGAAFVVLASEDFVQTHNLDAVEVIAGATLGGDPQLPGLAPVEAIQSVLRQADLAPDALKTVEIMEAFAVQAIACQRGAGIPPEIVNRHGGALARGHPIGASGAILAARLFHDLRTTKGAGLAAIAAAGGLGTALLLSAT
jgi:acetyl-CoA C-acetyltransferase